MNHTTGGPLGPPRRRVAPHERPNPEAGNEGSPNEGHPPEQ